MSDQEIIDHFGWIRGEEVTVARSGLQDNAELTWVIQEHKHPQFGKVYLERCPQLVIGESRMPKNVYDQSMWKGKNEFQKIESPEAQRKIRETYQELLTNDPTHRSLYDPINIFSIDYSGMNSYLHQQTLESQFRQAHAKTSERGNIQHISISINSDLARRTGLTPRQIRGGMAAVVSELDPKWLTPRDKNINTTTKRTITAKTAQRLLDNLRRFSSPDTEQFPDTNEWEFHLDRPFGGVHGLPLPENVVSNASSLATILLESHCGYEAMRKELKTKFPNLGEEWELKLWEEENNLYESTYDRLVELFPQAQ